MDVMFQKADLILCAKLRALQGRIVKLPGHPVRTGLGLADRDPAYPAKAGQGTCRSNKVRQQQARVKTMEGC